MAINRKVDTDDSGNNTSGTVHNNAWLQDLQDRIDALVGDWTNITFSAGNFTASTGTWTVASGDVLRNRYQIINKTLFWQLYITTTDVSSTPASLRIAIPSGTFASVNSIHRVDYLTDNSTERAAVAQPGDGTHLYITRVDLANFSVSTANTAVLFAGFWELS